MGDDDCGVTHNTVIPAKAGIHTEAGQQRGPTLVSPLPWYGSRALALSLPKGSPG